MSASLLDNTLNVVSLILAHIHDRPPDKYILANPNTITNNEANDHTVIYLDCLGKNS